MRALTYINAHPALRISLIYITFASAWIFFSDDFLQWAVSDASVISEIQTYKGILFVLVTGALLYQLVNHLNVSDLLPEQSLDPPRKISHKLSPLVLFGVLGLVIGISGWGIFNALRDSVRRDAQQDLIVSGQLKAKQIESWLKEREDDLVFDAADAQSSQLLIDWMRSGQGGEALGSVAKRFTTLKKIHHFTAIEVYDKDGHARFGDGGPSVLGQDDTARRVAAVNAPVLVDFYRHTADGPVSFGIMVPLRKNGHAEGALYAELDPALFLYPLIYDWPGISLSGETLLFRQVNGRIQYLNELRHQPNSALSFDSTAPNALAAAYAAAGKHGLLESFKDYRGKPVLGYVTEIRGTPWLMLVKVDQAEAYADINRLGLISALATVLLIGVSGFGVWLWWQRRQEHFAHMRKQEALDRLALEASYSALSKYANDIILLADETGKIIQVNDKALQTYGYTATELLGRHICELGGLSTKDCDREKARLEREGACLYETEHSRKDGSKFPVEVSARLIELEGSRFIHMVLRDITERKQAEESRHLAMLVYQHSSEAMMVTDLDGIIISINPAFTTLTGYTAEEAVGKSTSILKSGRQDKAFYKAFWHAIKTTGHWEGEIWNQRKSGEVFPEWLRINSIKNSDGSIHRLVALFSDITQKKASEALIWQQANFDQLTGLPNRRMFYDRLDQEMKKSRRSGQPMALMFLDLDHFKEVNDTLGHDVGDVLLKEAAQRLRSCVRSSDTVARLGGDEFTVIMGELDDLGSVERVAQDILQKLMEPFQLGLETAYVSASIGITLFPTDAIELDTLLRNADQAMYAAKHQGRNRFNYFTATMQTAAQARMRLANDLRTALTERQFQVHYQPIVNLANGEIHKAEALVRWQHPHLGLLSPSEFVPLSEEIGLIIDIGDWVFHEAAAQAARWRSLFSDDFQIGINKSPAQFLDESRIDDVDWFEYLDRVGVPGQAIAVDITEALLLDPSPLVMSKLLVLRDAGVQVSLDDFGTGYSSLSYLRKFDIDYLKIDTSFVHNLAPNSDDMALCEAIILMAHKLGIMVIAEGIETPEQRDLLMAVHCDYGQGFLFSRPLPEEEFEALLISRSKA